MTNYIVNAYFDARVNKSNYFVNSKTPYYHLEHGDAKRKVEGSTFRTPAPKRERFSKHDLTSFDWARLVGTAVLVVLTLVMTFTPQ